MDYAIIEHNELLETLKLSMWESYEWDGFKTVRTKDYNSIVWFEDEEEAIKFMKEHFPEEKIHPKYFPYEDITKQYYIGDE